MKGCIRLPFENDPVVRRRSRSLRYGVSNIRVAKELKIGNQVALIIISMSINPMFLPTSAIPPPIVIGITPLSNGTIACGSYKLFCGNFKAVT
jgi:hypothetical protein